MFADVASTLPVPRLIVVDESRTHRGMPSAYARAPRGQRAYATHLRNYGHNLTLLAGLRLEGMQAPMVIEGAVNTAVFEAYVRDVLCPVLHPGDIVLLDNLSCHKTATVASLIEARGASLLWLPKYSPDFSPIEKAFSKLKQFLKRTAALTVDALVDAIVQGLSLISPLDLDTLGWFCSCGYFNIDQST
jgi:transposase